MITLNFDEVLERTYNAKKGVDVRYGLGQGFEYCKQFADEAQGYATNAKASEKKATDAVAGIEQTKTDAVQAVQNAQTTATNAVQQAQSTATSAVTTKQTEAVQAVGTAQTGAVKAVDDERDAALQQVESSTATAKGYAESAASAANAAGNAATAAGGYASNAESSASAASGSASAAAESESNAATSAQSAGADADRAEAAAELAGTRANTDKTLKTENAPADAKTVGDYILDSEGNVIFYSKAAVNKLLAGKLDLTGGTLSGSIYVIDPTNTTAAGFGQSNAKDIWIRLTNSSVNANVGLGISTNGDYCNVGLFDFAKERYILSKNEKTGYVNLEGEKVFLNGHEDPYVIASGSNYVRFGDGTQICWGNIDTSRGSAIQFPIAFASNPAVTFTVGNGSTYSEYTTDFWWHNIGLTSFAFGRKDFSTSTITWIAIGRWK